MSSREQMLGLQKPEHLDPSLKLYASSYEQWLFQQRDQGVLAHEALASREQRQALLADWLRYLVSTGALAPQDRIPRHAALGEAFALSADQVAQVVRHLRQERVLVAHHRRSDAGVSQWNARDDYVLWWIGEQRAVRYDQVQCLLARESSEELQDPQKLSLSRTTQIIQRWQKAHLVAYRKIYVHQPGWIWLTRKGLAFVDLDYRASVPAEGSLKHLYYINEVRLLLEGMYEESQLTWTSERALQRALKEIRRKNHSLPHIPDAIVKLGHENIDIEVERTRKSQRELECTMRGAWGQQRSTHALRYYVSQQSWTTVQAAWKKVEPSSLSHGYRPWVEIVALDDLFKRPEQS